MVNQVLLNDTLQKINASLNKRFEKQADLYISKQDEYEIKKNLCNEAYGGIVDMAKAKGISHDIVVKVIMKNSGVLNIKDVGKFKRELKPILEDANYRTLSYMMEDVLANNIYMQKKIRHILFSYYMNGITDHERINYWEKGTYEFYITERSKLFDLIIEKNQCENPSKTLKFKINFIIDALKNYPDLRLSDVYTKLKNTLEEKEKKELFKFLCKEMEEPSINDDAYNFILTNAYVTYGEDAFNAVLSEIKSASPGNFKQYIRVICQLFRIEKDKDTSVRMFDNIFKVYDSPYIKTHIKREIDKKVWKVAKLNKELYEERKIKIDKYLSLTEQTDKLKYLAVSDVLSALSNAEKTKSIAYFWLNMKSPDFEKSVFETFTVASEEYLSSMNEIYNYLFEHSFAKGKEKELIRICERLTEPLQEFSSMNKSSVFFDALDRLWVEYVVQYKLKGQKIKKYMFEKHYERVWE